MLTPLSENEEDLALNEAWSQVLEWLVSLREMEAFGIHILQAMRDHEPGLYQKPSLEEAAFLMRKSRQNVRKTAPGWGLSSADSAVFASLTLAMQMGDSEDLPTQEESPGAGASERDWFEHWRRLGKKGQLWPAIWRALCFLEGGGDAAKG